MRYRGRSRAYLATALGLVGAVVVSSRFLPPEMKALPGVRQAQLLMFMGSGFALIELRRTLTPMPAWEHRAFAVVVGLPTAATLLLSVLVPSGAAPITGLVLLSILVLVWSACVAEPAVAFWRLSRTRPHVQRARLRALSVGYAAFALLVVAEVTSALVEAALRTGPMAWVQDDLSLLSLAVVPVLYSSFAPPSWLRHSWRAKEEALYRNVTEALITTASDEATMGARALEGAVRLLGAEGGLLVSPHGSMVTEGLSEEAAAALAAATADGRGAPGHDRLVVPLRSRSGVGRLVLIAGPVTPFFGGDEVNRISQYAVAVTAALDRSRESERLSTLLAAVGDLGEGLVITEAGRLVYANEAYADLTGYPMSELVGRNLLDLAPTAVREALSERVRDRIAGGVVPKHYESQLVTRDGRILDIETAVQSMPSEGPTRILALVRNITERKRGERALLEAAMVDPLTRMPNRRAWEEELPKAISRARRSQEPLCVAIMDIDRFKEFNDDWGHQRGDRLLSDIAAAWSGALREVDFLARYGGDEFAVVMPQCTGEDAVMVLERLDAVTPDHRHTTIGVARWDGSESAEELVGRADAALLDAKRAHRGEVRLAGEGGSDHFTGWAAHILRILTDQQLRSAYQPICELATGHVVGYEALARPTDDAGMSVEELFSAAHRLGLTRDLDWLGRKVAVQGARDLPAGTLLFVNVSISFLLDPVHDVDQMLMLLKWARRRPQDVVLEISEREVITDLARLRQVLADYRAEGFRFALDDVGEGHSTLEVLTAASAEYIKLARSLVQQHDDPASNAAIRAVAGFAHSTGTELIAEGVEDVASVAALRELGIELGQGYALGRPAFAAQPHRPPGAEAAFSA